LRVVKSTFGATLFATPFCLTLYVRMAIITTGVNAITVSVQDFVDLVEPQK